MEFKDYGKNLGRTMPKEPVAMVRKPKALLYTRIPTLNQTPIETKTV